MKKVQALLVIIFFVTITAKIYGFELWIVSDGNKGLPFQIKSENTDGSGKIYLYSIVGQKLHLISEVRFEDDMQYVSVFFDDGDVVRYKKLQPEIKKYLVVDKNNCAYILLKKQVGLSKPKWALYHFNSDHPLMTFEYVEPNAQANQFFATLSTGEVVEYILAEEHPISPMLNIPEIGAGLGVSSQY